MKRRIELGTEVLDLSPQAPVPTVSFSGNGTKLIIEIPIKSIDATMVRSTDAINDSHRDVEESATTGNIFSGRFSATLYGSSSTASVMQLTFGVNSKIPRTGAAIMPATEKE